METPFNFHLSHPTGRLATVVQGIWAASLPCAGSIVKPLYSDAGSGILFNFGDSVIIGDERLPEGVILLPVKKQAKKIMLSSGAQLAGIRFHPAMGYGVLGQRYEKPTLLLPEEDQLYDFYGIFSRLRMQKEGGRQVETLHLWTNKNLDFTHVIPDTLKKALEYIEQNKVLGGLSNSVELSQRQIERLFKCWLGMTPKQYHRIIRIKKTMCFLRQHKNEGLAGVAQHFGFSDQAHMTREFRNIACVTPTQL